LLRRVRLVGRAVSLAGDLRESRVRLSKRERVSRAATCVDKGNVLMATSITQRGADARPHPTGIRPGIRLIWT
jgi:hypothetical protein